jgi:FMN-dependent NADH-azoreductase
MKTLIIKYLPGHEISKTKQLYDHIKKSLINQSINEIDLEKTPPVFIDNSKLMSYYQRNYQGIPLNKEQVKIMETMDYFANSVKEADLVIVVSPMHNFGMPGIVKTWFDNVIQKGVAFDYGEKGPIGLHKGKKALTVFTSAGSYSTDKVTTNYPEWDTYSLLSRIEFGYMGFSEIEVVSASTGNPDKLEENVNLAKIKIEGILKRWLNE